MKWQKWFCLIPNIKTFADDKTDKMDLLGHNSFKSEGENCNFPHWGMQIAVDALAEKALELSMTLERLQPQWETMLMFI